MWWLPAFALAELRWLTRVLLRCLWRMIAPTLSRLRSLLGWCLLLALQPILPELREVALLWYQKHHVRKRKRQGRLKPKALRRAATRTPRPAIR